MSNLITQKYIVVNGDLTDVMDLTNQDVSEMIQKGAKLTITNNRMVLELL